MSVGEAMANGREMFEQLDSARHITPNIRVGQASERLFVRTPLGWQDATGMILGMVKDHAGKFPLFAV